MTLSLYFSPGACSLSPHIALREADLSFKLVQVDLKTKTTADGDSYLNINPKGYVPALRLLDGEVLTEGALIVQYIADRRPELNLAPPAGTRERRRFQEWLHFIATELQKGLSAINHPNANPEFKRALRVKFDTRLAYLTEALEDRPYLLGRTFTVADGYAYYVLRSLRRNDRETFESNATLKAYFERVESRPSVQSALLAEGLRHE